MFKLLLLSSIALVASQGVHLPRVYYQSAPRIAESLQWRQPICIAASKGLPGCSSYRSSDVNGQVRRSLRSAVVRNVVEMEQLEPSSLQQLDKDILVRGTLDLERLDRSKRQNFWPLRPIYETRVINSPITATLLARDCVPNIGVPLCTDFSNYQQSPLYSRYFDIPEQNRLQAAPKLQTTTVASIILGANKDRINVISSVNKTVQEKQQQLLAQQQIQQQQQFEEQENQRLLSQQYQQHLDTLSQQQHQTISQQLERLQAQQKQQQKQVVSQQQQQQQQVVSQQQQQHQPALPQVQQQKPQIIFQQQQQKQEQQRPLPQRQHPQQQTLSQQVQQQQQKQIIFQQNAVPQQRPQNTLSQQQQQQSIAKDVIKSVPQTTTQADIPVVPDEKVFQKIVKGFQQFALQKADAVNRMITPYFGASPLEDRISHDDSASENLTTSESPHDKSADPASVKESVKNSQPADRNASSTDLVIERSIAVNGNISSDEFVEMLLKAYPELYESLANEPSQLQTARSDDVQQRDFGKLKNIFAEMSDVFDKNDSIKEKIIEAARSSPFLSSLMERISSYRSNILDMEKTAVRSDASANAEASTATTKIQDTESTKNADALSDGIADLKIE